MDRLSLHEFIKIAENLTTELHRSLVSEGFTEAKAKEITIEKTKDMCRKQTKTTNGTGTNVSNINKNEPEKHLIFHIKSSLSDYIELNTPISTQKTTSLIDTGAGVSLIKFLSVSNTIAYDNRDIIQIKGITP